MCVCGGGGFDVYWYLIDLAMFVTVIDRRDIAVPRILVYKNDNLHISYGRVS